MLDLYNRSQKLLTVKKNFVKQAFYTTFFVSVLMVLVSLRYKSFDLTLSLAIGVVISFCTSLALWQWIKFMFRDLDPDRNLKRGQQPAKADSTVKSLLFACMGVSKILILALVFFLIFKFLPIKPVAFFVGVSVVQLVVFSMVVSIVFVNMLNNTIGVGSESGDNKSSRSKENVEVVSESVPKGHSHQIAENAL
ncbi:MAG: hypothetical protein GY941_15585 [Planctomycetes bacterium]|nr:hypothetical protein [Planctomycetota bacterium]